MSKNNNMLYLLRACVGAYLIYLAGSLGSGMISGEADISVIFIASTITFSLSGIALVFFSVRTLLKNKSADEEVDQQDEEQ